MPSPVIQGSVLIGLVPGVQMVVLQPADIQIAVFPDLMPESEDHGFAVLVSEAPDQNEADEPVPNCVISNIPMPAVFDLDVPKKNTVIAVETEVSGPGEPGRTFPDSAGKLMPSDAAHVSSTAVAPPLHLIGVLSWAEEEQGEPPVSRVVATVAAQDQPLTASLSPTLSAPDPAGESVQVAAPPGLAEAEFALGPEPAPAMPLPKRSPVGGATPAQWEDLVAEGGQAADPAPDRQATPLLPLPQPRAPEREVTRQISATVGKATVVGPFGRGLGPSSPFDRGNATVMKRHPANPPTALLLRFEGEGRAVEVRPSAPDAVRVPVWSLDAADAGLVSAPQVSKSVLTPPGQPPARNMADLPPAPRDLAPLGLVLPVLPAVKDKDPEPELAASTSVGGQMPNGTGPVAAGEGPKTVASNLSQLAAPILDVLVKGADGTTTLTLSPEELGKVRLSFRPDTQNSDRMVVMLAFDRPETMELFRRHADQLSEALRGAGYAGVQIGFGGSGEGNPHHPIDRAPSPESEGEVAPQDDAFPVPPPLRTGTLGGLDLRL